MTKQPRPLQKGDKIAIVAPARSVTPEMIEPSIELLSSWGLQPVVPESLFDRQDQFAGSDTHRRNLLQDVLDSSDISAILCAKGGYGTVRIIDQLDFSSFVQRPKWIIGFSDITVLHSHIHQHFHIETLHATMPTNIPSDATSVPYPSTQSLKQILFGNGYEYPVKQHTLNQKGCAEAEVVGGNLSILYSLMGSSSQIDTRGKILFIEDLDEYLYHIDRMMQGLKRCGMLDDIAGLIVGAMSDMHDNTVPFGSSAYEIIRDCVGDAPYPILFDAPFGHTATNNCALPLGRRILLSVNNAHNLITIPPSCC